MDTVTEIQVPEIPVPELTVRKNDLYSVGVFIMAISFAVYFGYHIYRDVQGRKEGKLDWNAFMKSTTPVTPTDDSEKV